MSKFGEKNKLKLFQFLAALIKNENWMNKISARKFTEKRSRASQHLRYTEGVALQDSGWKRIKEQTLIKETLEKKVNSILEKQ